MADELQVLTGGCLCGAVRYRVEVENTDGYYCHCRMCQLAFGNVFAAFLNVEQAKLEWLGEQPAFYRSSKLAQRGFCPHCGTPLLFAYDGSKRMDLSVSSFDELERIKPTSHFAVETRVSAWHKPDGLPEQRMADFEPINKRWEDAYGVDAAGGLDAVRRERDA